MLSDKTKKKIPKPVKDGYRAMRHCKHTLSNMAIRPFRYRYGYNRDHYLVGDNAERRSYKLGIIRPGDMGAAIAYALGVKTYEDVMSIFGADTSQQYWLPEDISCTEQAAQLVKHRARRPRLVVDVGCGRGEISALFTHIGTESIPIDPAEGAALLIGETFNQFYNLAPPPNFINKSVLPSLREIRKRGLMPDTFIFCESLEHIPRKEMAAAFEIIMDMLAATSGLLIITNWIHYHPIESVDMSWNHMTTIDDTTYDLLASRAKSTVFRQGSHLVLQF